MAYFQIIINYRKVFLRILLIGFSVLLSSPAISSRFIVSVYGIGTAPGERTTQIARFTSETNHFRTGRLFRSVRVTGKLVYAIAEMLDNGGGVNSAAKFMTILGEYCEQGPDCVFPRTVTLNELTTVAATATLQDSLNSVPCSHHTIIGNVNTGTCITLNASPDLLLRAATFHNLVNVSTGEVSSFLTRAIDDSPLYLTRLKLNTLANILASCSYPTEEQEAGIRGSRCRRLFTRLSNTTGGNVSNTVSAAHLIAHHSVANTDGAGLYGLPHVQAIYRPILNSAPANWTVAGKRFLYVINQGDHTISGYSIDSRSGVLRPLSVPSFATGRHPRSITIDPTSRFVYVVNASESNTLSVYMIDPASGILIAQPNSPFTIAPGLTTVAMTPNGRFLYVGHFLGKRLSGYMIDPSSGVPSLQDSRLTVEGVGMPIAMSMNGQFVYASNAEMHTLSAYRLRSMHEGFTEVHTVPLERTGFPISIAVAPNHRFAYVIVWSKNSKDTSRIQTYSIGLADPALAYISSINAREGKRASSLAITPTNRFAYVTNLALENVSAYTVDPNNGNLAEMSASPFRTGKEPTSGVIDPTGAFFYLANKGSHSISAYRIDQTHGALTELNLSPFSTGNCPAAIAMSG